LLGDFDWVESALLFAQEDAGADGWTALLQGPLLLFLILPLLFYFMVLGPERRRRHEHTAMLNQLKKNDVVITAGGIYGTIVNAPADSEDVTLRIDDSSNARMRVLRSAVSRVIRSDSKDEG
jgi:preprotein translocase subunit YajC